MSPTSRVWVTGAGGYVGATAATTLVRAGRQVTGLGNGTAYLVDRFAVVDGPVTIAALDRAAEKSGPPDAILHLAGGSSVGASIADPHADFCRTVPATADVAEWVRTRSPRTRIVFGSSAAVYGDGHHEPITEDAVPRPTSPYGYHKFAAELALRSYAECHDLDVVVLRLFSIYGPPLRRQLIWDASNRLVVEPRSTFFGDGHEARDWLYIDDAIELLRVCLDAPTSSGFTVVNGGTGVATSVRETLRLLASKLEARTEIAFNGQKRSGDPDYLVADVERLTQLGFRSRTTLADGLASYAAWFTDIGQVTS